jgi:uncharacterized repeat protein (TIGR03803 family)
MRIFRLLLISISITLCMNEFAACQTRYSVIYSFGTNGSSDGSQPLGRLTRDTQGNLYGTTAYGGNSTVPPCSFTNGCGTVFELSPNPDGSWTENILYTFCSVSNCTDGYYPGAGLVADSSGNLYGTTSSGGNASLDGTVFELSPPSLPGGAWTETVLWAFKGNFMADGCNPLSKLVFDATGNLYGTTSGCGAGKDAAGTVFELAPMNDGSWTEILLHTFRDTNDGAPSGLSPNAGVAFDQEGHLYGTTGAGGKGSEGVVYELLPKLGGGWAENVLHAFSITSGAVPLSSLSLDSRGNIYGTLSSFGSGGAGCAADGCGGVFKLSNRNGSWITSILPFIGTNGGNPTAGVFLQSNTAYGTTEFGGANGQGTVFSVHGKTSNVLYSFCSLAACIDGSQPKASLLSDSAGNLYGVASLGGASNQGVVFEITP